MANTGKMVFAIIGGGLSGTLLAAHLLTRRLIGAASDKALRILLIEREPKKMTRGVAYSTEDQVHLLNVPACNMSAYPDDPDHFLRWCERAGLRVGRDTFVPRKTYGAYLQDVLEEAKDMAAGENELEQIYDEVSALEVDEGERCAMLRLRYRGARYADRVVLACGNYAPANPPLETPEETPDGTPDFYASSPNYLRDPWKTGALDALDPARPALLIGTGLTMIDIVLSLKERGFRAPLYALSRHGHLPQAHAETAPLTGFDFSVGATPTARQLVKKVRHKVKEANTSGVNWRAVVNNLRPFTQNIWRSLNEAERRRFLRHARSHWEVHRHRMAPEIGAAINEILTSGQLKIQAGRLLSFRQIDDEVEVAYQPRGSQTSAYLHVGQVINCTGPSTNFDRIDDSLIRHLKERGYLMPDGLRLGLNASLDGALVNHDGEESGVLFTLGPFRKPQLWETTAAPEIRAQAAALAAQFAPALGAVAAQRFFTHQGSMTGVREQSLYDWVI